MIAYVYLLVCITIVKILQTRGKIVLNNRFPNSEKQNEQDRLFLIISFLFIVLLSSFRSYHVGPDTIQYLQHFERTCKGYSIHLDERFESGYKFLVYIVSRLSYNEQFFLTIMALIINIPIARFIYKYSTNKFLSVVLYITIGSFTFQLTGLRQSIAMSLCLIAIDFVLSRKLLPFVCIVIFAALFHKSAILFLPVYLFGYKVIRKKRIIVLIMVMITMFFSSIIFENVGVFLGYEEYINSYGVKNFGGWTIVLILIITLVLYLVVKNNSLTYDYYEKSNNIFFVVVIFALALYLMRYQVRVAERVSLYYRQAVIVLLPNAISRLNNDKTVIILNVLCSVLATLLFFYWLKGSLYLYTPFWEP